MPDSQAALALKRDLRRLFWATVGLFVAIVAVGFAGWLYTNSKADQTNKVLCIFRADLETRVKTSQKFLLEHPKGIAGFPASAIRVSVEGQLRTIAALGNLQCSE